eukprot:scaffold10297_cov113-Isochrysis_galbana.AAC.3
MGAPIIPAGAWRRLALWPRRRCWSVWGPIGGHAPHEKTTQGAAKFSPITVTAVQSDGRPIYLHTYIQLAACGLWLGSWAAPLRLRQHGHGTPPACVACAAAHHRPPRTAARSLSALSLTERNE